MKSNALFLGKGLSVQRVVIKICAQDLMGGALETQLTLPQGKSTTVKLTTKTIVGTRLT